jgi:hypothetical protein
MADTWTCSVCYKTLRCSCNSMECSFDYDIKDHVRRDLIRALETSSVWYEVKPAEMLVFIKRVLKDTNVG